VRRIVFPLVFAVLFSTSLFGTALAQQQAAAATDLPPAPQDPQAVAVLNQAIAVAGGAQALGAVRDYTAAGNVTYHRDQGDQDVQGTVTIIGQGASRVRLDASLPTGVRSWAILRGQTTRKTTDGKISQLPPPKGRVIPSSDALPYHAPMFPGGLVFPYLELVAALNNPSYAVSYKGLVQLDGRSAYDIQVERVMPSSATAKAPASPYDLKDYFIDASTSQVLMTQETVPKFVVHRIRYSDYRPVGGVLAPFSISEELGGQHTWDIELNQIGFNSGVRDSAFVLAN
jgi:hypothetical protein